jgi:hypothetical protein
MNDERLRNLNRRLRAGDPYDGASGLTPEEIRAMRRTVLTALPEPRRRLLPVLALAGAAVAALLIAVLAFRPGSNPPRPPAPRAAVAPAPLPPRPTPETGLQTPVAAPTPAVAQAETRRPHLRRHRRPPAGEMPAPNNALAALNHSAPADGTAIREIQFSTPGGTRIIWTLAPGKTSF